MAMFDSQRSSDFPAERRNETCVSEELHMHPYVMVWDARERHSSSSDSEET